MSGRLISAAERFDGGRVTLRLTSLEDCSHEYLSWLQDPEVNRFLETRWVVQTLEGIKAFVSAMLAADDSYLFAILDRADGCHVGNIKVGPVNPHHLHADVSYLIGDRAKWGRGLATDAIRTATRVAFDRLGLHRVQAGVYESNVASRRALEKAGFCKEGVFRKQLRGKHGWEDHLWYGLVRED